VTLVEGPSRTGKTTMLQQLLAGRQRVIYMPFRERRVSPVFVAKQLGNIDVMEEKAFGTSLTTIRNNI
jgi:predicted AAA+ superfamily ATPase